MSSYSKRTVECGNTNTEETYWLTKIADELGMYYHLSLRDKLIYRSSLV